MTCETIQPELAGYHFGALEDAARRQVEAHLVECPACVRSFVALKREIETAESGARPSPGVRDRVRQAVARELGIRPRPWAWWERPLAFGFAGAAVMVAVLAVNSLVTGPGAPPYGAAERPAAVEPAP